MIHICQTGIAGRVACGLIAAAVAAALTPARGTSETIAADNPYVVIIDTRPWIEALRSDDLFRTEPAIEALVSLGDRALPALAAAFATEKRRARVHIVETLRDIGTPATAPLLLRAAADPAAEVRTDAIEALGRLADERGRPAVEAALGDPSTNVVRAAAAACEKLCTSPSALRRLAQLALDPATSGPARRSLRDLAAGDDGDAAAATIAEIVRPALSSADSVQQFNAALLLAATGDHSALPVLRDCALAPVHPLLAVECVNALDGASGSAKTALLAEVARDGNVAVQRAACTALAARGDEGATPQCKPVQIPSPAQPPANRAAGDLP